MKTWISWVAPLSCAGLCLVLAGCGGSSIPDPSSDAKAATAAPPAAAAPVAAPAPAPEPAAAAPVVAEAAPAAAPAPAATPTPEAAAAPAPEAAATPPPAKAEEAAAKTEPATPVAAAASPAPEATSATANAAAPAPAPAPTAAADAAAKEANPFAVFSETPATAPASGSGSAPAETAAAATAAPVDAAPVAENPPAEADQNQGALSYSTVATANRGKLKDYYQPMLGTQAFLNAIKAKDLKKIAEATSLHAPLDANTGNQKLFTAILEESLADEDLDELAKKLDKYTISGNNQPKSSGTYKVTISKYEGKSTMRRTITMRHEKSGWKVQDISGEGEIKAQIMLPNMRGGMGRGRR